MERITILTLIISIILVITIEGILIFNRKKDNNIPLPPINDEAKEENTKVNNLYTNENNMIYKEHCIDKLCVTITHISYVDNMGIYDFESQGAYDYIVVNKDSKKYDKGSIYIVFKDNDVEYTYNLYVPELDVNEQIEIESMFLESNILKATNYTLKNISN